MSVCNIEITFYYMHVKINTIHKYITFFYAENLTTMPTQAPKYYIQIKKNKQSFRTDTGGFISIGG